MTHRDFTLYEGIFLRWDQSKLTSRPVKINDTAGNEGGGGCGGGGGWSECDHNEDVVGLYCAQYIAPPYLIYDIKLWLNCEL